MNLTLSKSPYLGQQNLQIDPQFESNTKLVLVSLLLGVQGVEGGDGIRQKSRAVSSSWNYKIITPLMRLL